MSDMYNMTNIRNLSGGDEDDHDLTYNASHTVQKWIEKLIASGAIRPGEKLLPERQLAKRLGVSRNVLRDSLKVLAEKNLIRSTQGRGNYVNEVIGSDMTDPLALILRESSQALDDFMEFRCEFEGAATFFAAERATAADIEAMKVIIDRMEIAHLAKDHHLEAELDIEFHITIIESTHNIIFTHVGYALKSIMQQEFLSVRLSLFDKSIGVKGIKDRQLVLKHHNEIFSAIASHDSELALNTMRSHISFVREKLREMDKISDRSGISSERLRRWTSFT